MRTDHSCWSTMFMNLRSFPKADTTTGSSNAQD